mmetsp:Transcript_20137/g.43601  ORF Transcript_20137/g.43601 Transcript_20137/m.43601 type:complete len:244 (+) Transcript_20137:134-865(+)
MAGAGHSPQTHAMEGVANDVGEEGDHLTRTPGATAHAHAGGIAPYVVEPAHGDENDITSVECDLDALGVAELGEPGVVGLERVHLTNGRTLIVLVGDVEVVPLGGRVEPHGLTAVDLVQKVEAIPVGMHPGRCSIWTNPQKCVNVAFLVLFREQEAAEELCRMPLILLRLHEDCVFFREVRHLAPCLRGHHLRHPLRVVQVREKIVQLLLPILCFVILHVAELQLHLEMSKRLAQLFWFPHAA